MYKHCMCLFKCANCICFMNWMLHILFCYGNYLVVWTVIVGLLLPSFKTGLPWEAAKKGLGSCLWAAWWTSSTLAYMLPGMTESAQAAAAGGYVSSLTPSDDVDLDMCHLSRVLRTSHFQMSQTCFLRSKL
jgi:hypothetical protein